MADIVFQALVGSKIAKSIPNFELVQNEMRKHVFTPIPFLGTANDIGIEESDFTVSGTNQIAVAPNIERQFFPLSFRKKTETNSEPWYTFPYEPLITISGKNVIVKRYVAKAPQFIGSVKERFTQDDYQITITGSLIGYEMTGTPEKAYPREDFEALREYCTHPNGIEVLCEPFQLLGITSIVVEDFTFPFTKGENVQAYELKAVSDFTSEILLEIE